ncbi:MAG TPA: four helix bundle protein [Terriglobales bacterium]|nr:four helix bundle protein [Terriglobales bacterium]
MESKQEELRGRTKKFALRIIRLFKSLPRSPEAQILGKQLLRSGASVGANYRAAGRARSNAEFSAKIGIVVEEADETVFWLECMIEAGIVKQELLQDLLREANELVACRVVSNGSALVQITR